MKKSNFVAMILGTISLIFFALGMCMSMLPEWNSFEQGIVVGGTGLILALITIFIWRKMEHKEQIKITAKSLFVVFISIIGTLAFGIGMCLCMVWTNIVLGITVGLIGIIILLCLIPICKGLR